MDAQLAVRGGRRKYLWSRWAVWPWHSNVSWETLQKKTREICVALQQKVVFANSLRTFGMNVEQTAVRKVRGGVCFTLWVEVTED